MNIAIVLGTRPEIIKMAPVIWACEKAGLSASIYHTGQHYSHELDGLFLDQFQLPKPRFNISIGSGTHAEQTAKALVGLESAFVESSPDAVLVQGDTNTAMAGALAASKLNIPVGHVEAGLRSYDRKMPEEINRVLADHLSDMLFAPTEDAAAILRSEGISADSITVTGNTVVDAMNWASEPSITAGEKLLDELKLTQRNYVLMTAHRPENVDSAENFTKLLEGAVAVGKLLGMPVIFPAHLRSKKRIEEFDLKTDGVTLIPPVDYWTMIGLERFARLILTDSGGLQEEACVLQVPCVTLRSSTERPETIEVGANILGGIEPAAVVEAATKMIDAANNWSSPFGDGDAGVKTVARLKDWLGQTT